MGNTKNKLISITMSDSTNSTKFRVSGKKPECFKSFSEKKTAEKTSICLQSQLYNQNHCTEVLMESPYSSRAHPSNNGFIRTVIDCYNDHHNLVIRPDDIWTAILTQFSFYINKNAEEFRNQFVNFEGKKELVVTIGGTLRAAPYDLFVTKMTEKIDENLVDKTVKNWILPNFSTTTTEDMISCGIVFMATMKKYFEFTCCLMCGIPYITLEGTLADWESILSRLEKLKDYKLDKWYEMLKPILEEFIAAKNNKPNVEFWNRICNNLGGGSGPSYISGWLTAFAVFDVEGNWTDHGSQEYEVGPWPVIDMDKIPTGIVAVDVKIVEGDVTYESVMFAGHTGFEVLRDNYTLKPQIGWSISLKLSAAEVEKFHETARGEGRWRCEKCGLHLEK
ncbi:uncharacterized protein LOC119076691 isoform X1 [Bradysia coprophila]|uniref:uncharacterized protein LOC119076691 isoform X1 n=1 Tax=Bradysia coprophila TaxID=38358 RepID=UPI00187DC9F5|nr:uncharacterized protein LOC119076691 isoform X1 [Bradysia coprophila]